jgi:hypothetical protein
VMGDRVRKRHQPAGIKPDPALGLVLRRRVRGLSPPEKGKDVMHVRVRDAGWRWGVCVMCVRETYGSLVIRPPCLQPHAPRLIIQADN